MLRVSTVMTGVVGAPYFSQIYFGGTTVGQAAPAAAAVRGFWDSIKGLITAGLVMQVQPDVEAVDPVTGLITGVFSTSSVAVNSGGNAPLPKATQGLLRLRTGVYVSGKEIRGRIFIPALANDSQLGGVPSAALTAGAQSACTAMAVAGAAAGDLVVWSRKNGQHADVVSNSLWNQFAVLRSRRD